ncbi:MAG TPA: MucR family transcriptional regulator [Stellaceae bacterium]|nr:MucR family transcriptional regulator [Stellaceae bacterium]
MTEPVPNKAAAPAFLRLTTDVVAAYLRNNALPNAQIAEIINSVYRSLRTLDHGGGVSLGATSKPAVPVRKSIQPEFLVCLEDGKRLKMLKRHLRSTYNLTPDQYRQKWGLPADYPMVAPNYAEERSSFAKKIGLGRSAGRKDLKRGSNGARK